MRRGCLEMARQLIRYAGFDPKENDFSGLEFPAMRIFALGKLPKKDRINDEVALRLREDGLSLKTIGELMASVNGRNTPYKSNSISNACWRARKKRKQ